ncbi:MAG: EutN/CcmL family microcompartment protein [Actinomycetota bacterium]|jgi:ethanolamine utilization protein EutN|nr:EutN/CcmL family microcompartment protein [Actinomycetota bacterium]
MRLGKVIGNVVSTSKHERLQGIKLLVLEPLDPDGRTRGRKIIVADYLNAASGSLVYWIENGVTICKVMGIRSIPIRGCIVGLVDSIDLEGGKVING